MIEIKDKCQCSGCSACEQRCPRQCISLKEDQEGFMYPFVDIENCIDCGLCEKVCPIINQGEPRFPLKVFAAKNKNEEIRLKSSSGGIFTLLAESIIQEGGVVFGARFDESWNVIHDYTETIEGLAAFRGSKYVQSRIGRTFRQVESFLKTGRKVMFTGTPCQVSGLKHYLLNDYDNLLTVDFVCHGVPSPLVWREYLQTLFMPKNTGRECTVLSSHTDIPVISDINFRDKLSGWKKFGFVVRTRPISNKDRNNGSIPEDQVFLREPFYENIFMRGFLHDIYLRPSCYDCQVKSGKSGADITMGDFWGIDNHLPEFDDDKGVSIVLVQSEKGITLIDKCSMSMLLIPVGYQQVFNANQALERSAYCAKKYREYFWNGRDGLSSISRTLKKMKPSLVRRTLSFVRRALKK